MLIGQLIILSYYDYNPARFITWDPLIHLEIIFYIAHVPFGRKKIFRHSIEDYSDNSQCKIESNGFLKKILGETCEGGLILQCHVKTLSAATRGQF